MRMIPMTTEATIADLLIVMSIQTKLILKFKGYLFLKKEMPFVTRSSTHDESKRLYIYRQKKLPTWLRLSITQAIKAGRENLPAKQNNKDEDNEENCAAYNQLIDRGMLIEAYMHQSMRCCPLSMCIYICA